MVFRTEGQRRGRAYYWFLGILALGCLGLFGYQWWTNLDRQDQNDDRLKALQDAKLDAVRQTKADPKDWPQWRGPHRDAIAPADGLLTEWPAGGLKRLWQVKGGPGFSAVCVSGKRLVTMLQDGKNEAVVCWEDTGKEAKELWRYKYDSYFSQDGEGPRGTPTIDGDRVYSIGPRGHLYCLDMKGEKKWNKDLISDFGGTMPRWGYSSSPLVEGDLLLLNPGGKSNTVVALDKKTGETVWKAALDEHPGYSSPVISEAQGVRQVLFFLGASLTSLDPRTGKVLWRYPWDTKYEVNAATPIVRGDYVFISSGYAKGCALVQVVKDGEGLKAEKVYENNLMKNHFGSSVFVKDHLYGFDEGYLVSMPFREGKKRGWKEGKFKKGTLMAVGEQLIVLGENGELALVEANPKEFTEKASFRVVDARCWTMPIVARGRLYIRDEANIYCYDLSKE